MKSRQEIVNEMLTQIQGVFNFYTDQKLTDEQIGQIRSVLDQSVPQEYTSEGWTAYSNDYQARVEAEAAEVDSSDDVFLRRKVKGK